ncbi:cytochrome oxidase assembly protein shy1 [Sesbania bispinosa]|nr:cytochrome oxidase assembly protein shy1 [Sesbania bispinosa]
MSRGKVCHDDVVEVAKSIVNVSAKKGEIVGEVGTNLMIIDHQDGRLDCNADIPNLPILVTDFQKKGKVMMLDGILGLSMGREEVLLSNSPKAHQFGPNNDVQHGQVDYVNDGSGQQLGPNSDVQFGQIEYVFDGPGQRLRASHGSPIAQGSIQPIPPNAQGSIQVESVTDAGRESGLQVQSGRGVEDNSL